MSFRLWNFIDGGSKKFVNNVLCTLNRTTLLSVFMNILIKIEIQRPNIFHFKAFGMMNLHNEVRICQKIYNRVTMTVYVKGVV